MCLGAPVGKQFQYMETYFLQIRKIPIHDNHKDTKFLTIC
jgi:hypothetical protein